MPPGDADLTYAGELRAPGSILAQGTVTLGEASAILAVDGTPPRTVSYRDMAVIAISEGVGLLATGDGAGAERWLLQRFGPALGPLIALLRERRLRQRLADAFVVLPAATPVDLVEYATARETAAGPGGPPGTPPPASGASPIETGVAQLALDEWGLTLAPLDERRPVQRVRRADITGVDLLPGVGGVRVSSTGTGFDLLRLGAAAARHRTSLGALPAAAYRDAGAIVAALVPDLQTGAAGRAASALVDGRPASPGDLGDAWAAVERGVLSQPTFAASYLALRERAGGAAALRWLALAPERPSAPNAYRAWFLVALPGNLVALELVSEGAHATYCFRTVPRAAFAGGVDPGAIDAPAAGRAVARISAALIDARFLREPMALPEDQLARPDGIRYRLALRAIPSLSAARAAFVARLVHHDEQSWSAALDDLIAWHAACRDDALPWPGRAAEEALVSEAAGAAHAGGAPG